MTKVGWTFPGVTLEEIDKALENRKNNDLPQTAPIVRFYPMSNNGAISIKFSEDMILPNGMD